MKLKVGELAQRAGLTVRALHHYDSIGLLSPSARSDAGYRLYDRGDIARLHQIQALRRSGVALAEIGAFLDNPGTRLPAIVDQQIAALDRQIAQAGLLRGQLAQLQCQLAAGEEPGLAEWLTTLELMTMYDKYFTKEQRERLPFFAGPEDGSKTEWDALVAAMRATMDAGTAPADPAAQALAIRWMDMIVRDTGGEAQLLVQLNEMNDKEPSVRERNGITPALQGYVLQAFGAYRLGLYEKYLTPEEFAFTRANYGRRAQEWPPLIARVQKEIDAGTAPTAPAAAQLADEWMDLFCSYAGTDPATHARIRQAHAVEPALRQGTFVTEKLLDFLRPAIAAAAQRKAG